MISDILALSGILVPSQSSNLTDNQSNNAPSCVQSREKEEKISVMVRVKPEPRPEAGPSKTQAANGTSPQNGASRHATPRARIPNRPAPSAASTSAYSPDTRGRRSGARKLPNLLLFQPTEVLTASFSNRGHTSRSSACHRSHVRHRGR